MIGESRVNTSTSGTRRIFFRLRRVIVTVSDTVSVSACSSRRHLLPVVADLARRSCSLTDLLGRVPGQVQEDVVEGRSAQADVGDLDPLGVQAAQQLDEVSATTRRPARSRGGRARRPSASPMPSPSAWVLARARSAASRDHDLDALSAELGLQLVAGARARSPCRGRSPRSGRPTGRPPRGTAWSAAGWCPRGPAPRSRPTSRSGPAGRARSWARRGTAPAAWPPGRRRGRADAASRPRTP